MSDASDSHNREELLAALQAHGQDFLSSFDLGRVAKSARKRRKLDSESKVAAREASSPLQDPDETENDWHGFSSESELESGSGTPEDEGAEGGNSIDCEFACSSFTALYVAG